VTWAAEKYAVIQGLYKAYAKTDVLLPVSDGKRLVPGDGPLDAPLVVVGEAPGEQEDKLGRPFVGRSGQKLQQLFRQAGIPWDLCYKMNVLPWRPKSNRTPYPFEIQASMRRVQAEIATIAPQVVVAAGSVAWQAITSKKLGYLAEHRGKWVPGWSPEGHEGFSCDLLAITHPAAILRERREDWRAAMEEETVTALRSVLEGERATA
jgi:uracil-DNA glycosylase